MEYISADELVMEKTFDDLKGQNSPFLDKAVLVVNDIEGGNYNGRITFDTSNIGFAGRYMDWGDGVIQAPLIVAAQTSSDMTSVMNSYSLGLKSGHYQLVDSLSITYNNSTVINIPKYANMFINYEVITSWSEDEYKKYGALTGVQLDDALSYRYNSGASIDGDGYTNNRSYSERAYNDRLFTTAASLSTHNEGLQQRLKSTAPPVGSTASLNWCDSAAEKNELAQGYYTTDGASGASRIYYIYVVATIRLRDLSDFFKKLPLVKGASIGIEIGYNASRVVVTGSAASPSLLSQTTTTMLHGNTSPFMVSSSAVGNPLEGLFDTNGGTMTIECNVRSTTSPAGTNPLLSRCQLRVPAYSLRPEFEAEYLSMGQKEISFDAVISTEFNVPASGTFTQILNSGVVDPKSVVLIPLSNISTFPTRSVFDTCGGTFHGIPITDFNVDVAGRQVFNRDLEYDWDTFYTEVSKSNALGGGLTPSTTGLLSYEQWKYGYRAYPADISRVCGSETFTSKAILVRGKNASGVAATILGFIKYERKAAIDIESGIMTRISQ